MTIMERQDPTLSEDDIEKITEAESAPRDAEAQVMQAIADDKEDEENQINSDYTSVWDSKKPA
jgi:hypothetical protein